MYATEKLNLLGKLVVIGQEHASLEVEMIEMIAKVAKPPAYVGPKPAPQPISPTLDEMCLARSRGKIPAIKAYRTRTGQGLKESKDAIEKAMNYLGWAFHGHDDFNGSRFPSHVFEDLESVPF